MVVAGGVYVCEICLEMNCQWEGYFHDLKLEYRSLVVTFYLDLLTVFKSNGMNTLNHARITDEAAK